MTYEMKDFQKDEERLRKQAKDGKITEEEFFLELKKLHNRATEYHMGGSHYVYDCDYCDYHEESEDPDIEGHLKNIHGITDYQEIKQARNDLQKDETTFDPYEEEMLPKWREGESKEDDDKLQKAVMSMYPTKQDVEDRYSINHSRTYRRMCRHILNCHNILSARNQSNSFLSLLFHPIPFSSSPRTL